MIMYSPNGKSMVDVHPTQVDNMKRKGWTAEQPTPVKKSATNLKPKVEK